MTGKDSATHRLALLLLGLFAGFSESASASGPAAIGSFGLDVAGRDLSVRPGDDFFRYSGGAWMQATRMPSDKTRFGTFDQLADKAEADVRAIVEKLAAQPQAPDTNEQKIADFYSSYLDVAAIEQRGLEPARLALADIARVRNHEALAALIARPDLPLAGPIGSGISLDQKNPDRYRVVVTHSGLGLPEREYYLRDDAQFLEIRTKYQAHVTRLLALGGQRDAAASAAKILALETEIARLHWPIARRRERDQTYNLRTLDQLRQLAPDYPWAASLRSAGWQGEREFIVRELDAIAPLATLFRRTPVATWRAYLTYHYLRNSAALLPAALDAEVFDFFGRTLNGQPEPRPRWKRAIDALDGSLGEAVGQIYVAAHFPADSKVKMLALVENLRRAYGQRIDQLPWMTAATKLVAREKLAAFRPKIGYPDRWRDYTALKIRRGDAFGNSLRVRLFVDAIESARLGKPSDRDEWAMTPQTVNAYYNPVFNEVVFPAAILQPPFFDANADAAINYGAIGGVIGHEMGHGFDDQGAKSDARGVLRTWWNPQDEAAFKLLGDRLVEQYSAFEPLPGLKLNGRLSLGENIGDLGGLSVAHEAYRLSLAGAEAPTLEGFTGDQRFFHAWAQVWRTVFREQRLRNQVMTGPHSPAEFRVNGVVRNIDAWYSAFDIKPGDRLYLAPERRVRIW